MTTLAVRWRAHQAQRLRDKLADAESELSRWGFSMKPSQIRKLEARIARLQHRLNDQHNQVDQDD